MLAQNLIGILCLRKGHAYLKGFLVPAPYAFCLDQKAVFG